MKGKIPYCPHCKSNNFVVLDKKSIRIGTAVGGTIGAGAAYIALLRKTGSASTACTAVAVVAMLMPLLLGFMEGAKVGGTIGEQIDGNMRITFRCNQCGKKFNG